MRNEGVLAEIRRIPKSPLQPKFEKMSRNVILQKVSDIIPKHSKLYLDSGYQGIQNDFPNLNSVIPFKRTRNHQKLTHSEKIQNHKQRKIRVVVEHTISQLKKFNVLSQIYRNSPQNYQSTFRFVANVVNFRMLERLQPV